MLARSIREGVGHDGRPLTPDPIDMPYTHFKSMSEEDIASVIVYLRSLPAVPNALPKTNAPLGILKEIENVPEPLTQPVPEPDLSTPVKRGAYLVTLGNCTSCHTPSDANGRPLAGLDFAGGEILEGPWGRVASANLTPDPSGIPYYDDALFITTLRTGRVKVRKLNSIMPWGYFRNMTDEDLKSIFSYLRMLKPVRHRVDNTEPPTFCKRCNAKHGAGDLN